MISTVHNPTQGPGLLWPLTLPFFWASDNQLAGFFFVGLYPRLSAAKGRAPPILPSRSVPKPSRKLVFDHYLGSVSSRQSQVESACIFPLRSTGAESAFDSTVRPSSRGESIGSPKELGEYHPARFLARTEPENQSNNRNLSTHSQRLPRFETISREPRFDQIADDHANWSEENSNRGQPRLDSRANHNAG